MDDADDPLSLAAPAGDPSASDDDYIHTHSVLLAAAHHDLDALKDHLRNDPGAAKVQDAETGYTPLHAAIAALAPETAYSDSGAIGGGTSGVNGGGSIATAVPLSSSSSSPPPPPPPPPQPTPEEVAKAEATLHLLFENGAIWNDLDARNETPGCLAWRLGLKSLYEIMVEAGVRAELLLNRLDDFEVLQDEEDDDDDDDEDDDYEKIDDNAVNGHAADDTNEHPTADRDISNPPNEPAFSSEVPPAAATQAALLSAAAESAAAINTSLTNPSYLASTLRFRPDSILDADANGVMMRWESTIMRRTAALLLPRPGLRVLNVGHGMGIIDSFLAELRPSRHHIVEAHPEVVAEMRKPGGWLEQQQHRKRGQSRNAAMEEEGGEKDGDDDDKDEDNAVRLHEGRWQDVLPRLADRGLTFDAIFFDTFAEGYRDFKQFFDECVIALLDGGGCMSFFHGLGADRRVCHDVYTRVVEMDLFDAGLEVEWEKVRVVEPQDETDGDEEEEERRRWEGVRRKYWDLEEYRLPICRFVG